MADVSAVRVLVAAGLEPSGRMGLLADLETLRRCGVTGLAVCTAVTAQGRGPFSRTLVAPKVVHAQVAGALDAGVKAVKVGMVPTRACLRALLSSLERVSVWRVVDPVVRSSSGAALSSLRPGDFASLATSRAVLTPNALEAAWLLGARKAPTTAAELEAAGQKLFAQGWGGVLVKGGHLEGSRLVDVLVTAEGVERLTHGKLPRSAHHRGTGCRHASGMAAALALGMTLPEAARMARRVVQGYLRLPPLLAGEAGRSAR